MKITVRDAILTAISYADIFDYPLTEEELATWLPFRAVLKRSHLAIGQGETLKQLQVGNVTYYALRSVKHLYTIRRKRAFWSDEKGTRVRRVATLLKLIPTINLVGVTGGLTRSNTRAEDDIDILIITSPKTLWVTRVLTTILLDVLRLRRRPSDTNVRNLVCLNMFMSEDGLSVPKKERDLFVAHEVLLMKPIWERDNAYIKFLRANMWVKTFLPKAWEEKCRTPNAECRMNRTMKRENLFSIWHLAFCILEPLARVVQLSYMSKRRSTEIVTDKVIRFHPRDARVWIKRALGRRLSRFNIPLDKIFYGR